MGVDLSVTGAFVLQEMVVDASSLRRASITELELSFHQSMEDARTLLALEAELNRRSLPRARELRGRVRQQLASPNRAAKAGPAKPWYQRRGIVLSVVAVVAGGITQGICHAIGFHMFEPVWSSLQRWMAD
jgi:hypothetical protein